MLACSNLPVIQFQGVKINVLLDGVRSDLMVPAIFLCGEIQSHAMGFSPLFPIISPKSLDPKAVILENYQSDFALRYISSTFSFFLFIPFQKIFVHISLLPTVTIFSYVA